MSQRRPIQVTICMGSSCFSRGNNRNIEVLQAFAAAHAGRVEFTLAGHLCQDRCRQGPNIVINRKMHQELDPVTLLALLNQRLES
jgi:NADH:ubiquinone oxidoreductase subunit E